MSVAIVAAGLGLMLGQRDYLFELHDDLRSARRVARNAADSAISSKRLIDGFLLSGEHLRIQSPRVADFITGLAYPQTPADSQPSAFASAPVAISRPMLTEAQAVAPGPWPGATATYDGNGMLVNPTEAADGQYFLVGLALGYAEVRAGLLGLTLGEQNSNPEVLAANFRCFRGLALALQEQANTDPMSQDAMAESWRIMLKAPKVARGVVWALPTSTAASSTTADVAHLEIPFSKDLLKPGECARLTIAGAANLASGLSDWRVRFDSVSNPALLTASYPSLTGSVRFKHVLEFYRYADSAGSQFYGLSQSSMLGNLCSSNGADVGGAQAGVDHKLVFSFFFAAVGQSAFVRYATLEKL